MCTCYPGANCNSKKHANDLVLGMITLPEEVWKKLEATPDEEWHKAYEYVLPSDEGKYEVSRSGVMQPPRH